MSRLFPEHRIRTTCSLDGTWQFYFPKQGTLLEAKDWRQGEEHLLEVPGVWEVLNSRVNYRGQAVARRVFRTEREGPARLVFKGVSHTGTVYLDGERIGFHHNAYTPFSLHIPQLSAGEHELLVHISNQHGEISGLHIPNDYYNYGGINRPVTLELPERRVFIGQVRAVPRFDATRASWALDCTVLVENLGDPKTVELELLLADARVVEHALLAEHGTTEFRCRLEPRSVRPWSYRDPALYLLSATLSQGDKAFDDWCDRIGFRTVSVQGERLLVNDEPVFLLGFNRHEDHALYGCALPLSAMRKDLALLRDLNCNAVRTSHYPNDERFLDLCDQAGLMVWEENHARGQDLSAMQHPRFREQCYEVTGEMVREHFNHPSIVTWGVMNECASETEVGREMYAEQFAFIKSLDRSRPTTFASCRHQNDICQDLPDIAGWNLYPRWYDNVDPLASLEELIHRFEPKGMARKPLIVSETGAGALPGYLDPIRRAKWSEERQADILNEMIRAYGRHPRLSGLFIWQFCDVRVDEARAIGRPRCMNNKGVVDEHRRPKLAYPLVQELFLELQR
ncbi:MAG TPA: glycoside hydrolase family 2 TIM barrel-domain containing protein [Polyangiaceae bacterium]